MAYYFADSTVKVNLISATDPADFGRGTIVNKRELQMSTIMRSLTTDYRARTDNPLFFIPQIRTGTDTGGKKAELLVNRVNDIGDNVWPSSMHLVRNPSTSTSRYKMESPEDYFYNVSHETYSRGFGHGTQIAMEYAPDGKYLWIDHNGPVIDRDKTTDEGEYDVRGEQLCRVKYITDATYNSKSVEVQPLKMEDLGLPAGGYFKGCGFVSCSFDNVNQIFAVMYTDYTDNLKTKIAVYKYDYVGYANTAKSINFQYVAKYTVPKREFFIARKDGKCSTKTAPLPMKGFKIFAGYIYIMWGTAYWAPEGSNYGQQDFFSPQEVGGNYSDGTPITKRGNTILQSYRWGNGAFTLDQETHTEAHYSQTHREPQGIDVVPFQDANGNVTALRLLMGFAGGVTGDRYFAIYQKHTVL